MKCVLFHEFLGLPAGTDALLWISSFLGFWSSKLLSQCQYKVQLISVVRSKFQDSSRTCTNPTLSAAWLKLLTGWRSHPFGQKLIWNICIVGCDTIFFFFPPKYSFLLLCVCVCALTVTGMPLQHSRKMFNYMGSKMLHYKRADRVEGRKRRAGT